jgi:hypothetical protein
MTNALEDKLWESAGARSVAELPEFPFRSYQDFKTAVESGEATIGIEYAAARDLAHVTKSRSASYLLLALTWLPFLLAFASIILAIVTRQWLILAGSVTALLGMVLASPHNPMRRPAFWASLLALGYNVFVRTVLSPGAWSGFAFAVSFLAVSFVNRTAWNWAHAAVLRSEALTAYLWKAAQLHIRSDKFGMKSLASRRGATPQSKDGT